LPECGSTSIEIDIASISIAMVNLRSITQKYPAPGGGRSALDDINLRIRPGEKIGVLGRNGAAKSALDRIIRAVARASVVPIGPISIHGL
jgi:ABC-type polysaccharide/polyol phosphate transport system ATPase subunit